MNDGHDESSDEEEPTTSGEEPDEPTTGRVRIIGAQEAAEALASGEAHGRRAEGELGYGDRPDEPVEDEERPILRFPRPMEARDPSSFGAVPVVRVSDEDDSPAGPPGEEEPFELPHYSDPPTGQVPSVVSETSDEGESWSGVTASPRWRDRGQHFDDDDDFSDLVDDGPRLGALGDEGEEGDDDFFDLGSELDDTSGYGDYGDEVVPGSRREVTRVRRRSGGGGGGDGGGETGAEGGRNLPQAIAVGVGLAVLGLVCFALGTLTTTLLVMVVVTLAAIEYFGAVRLAGYNPATLLGLVAVASMAVATAAKPELAYPVVIGVVVIATLVWYLWVSPGKGAVTDIGVTLLGIGWIGGLGSFATFLLGLGRRGEDAFGLESNPGIGVLLGAVLVSVSYDVGGYFVGRYFGRTPLSEVSPNKTQEGLIGGVFVALFLPFLVLKFVPGIAPLGDSAADAFAFALVCALLAPAGDLCQSMIKRDLGIKDMGSLLPAHGGILDRFDGLLFVLPTAWFMAHLLEVGTDGFTF